MIEYAPIEEVSYLLHDTMSNSKTESKHMNPKKIKRDKREKNVKHKKYGKGINQHPENKKQDILCELSGLKNGLNNYSTMLDTYLDSNEVNNCKTHQAIVPYMKKKNVSLPNERKNKWSGNWFGDVQDPNLCRNNDYTEIDTYNLRGVEDNVDLGILPFQETSGISGIDDTKNMFSLNDIHDYNGFSMFPNDTPINQEQNQFQDNNDYEEEYDDNSVPLIPSNDDFFPNEEFDEYDSTNYDSYEEGPDHPEYNSMIGARDDDDAYFTESENYPVNDNEKKIDNAFKNRQKITEPFIYILFGMGLIIVLEFILHLGSRLIQRIY
jgi:hypothetical protein